MNEIALEDCEMEALCFVEGNGRIRFKGGFFLPGEIIPEGYRAFNYGFVYCRDMDGVSYCGIPLASEQVIVEPRIVVTVAKAGQEEKLARTGEIKILSTQEAIWWIQDNFTIHNGRIAPWPDDFCPHKEWADRWESDFERWKKG